jgi:prepilin-type N-terminal cleavage/methylation domain-containing protein
MLKRIRRQLSRDDGFTLLELIVVMVIIGILAAISIPALSKMQEKKRLAEGGTPKPTPEPSAPPGDPFTVNWSVIGLVAMVIVFLVFLAIVGVAMFQISANKRNAASQLSDRWKHALDKHNVIRDEYAELTLDPVKSLQHSALWDVGNDRTRKFHEAYAEAQDIASLWGTKQPTDEATIAKYEKALRSSVQAWEDAVKHAARLGYQWMPKEDADSARKAVGLIKKSRDTAATESERALSAQKAKELIDGIGVVFFPKETTAAVEALVRVAIAA